MFIYRMDIIEGDMERFQYVILKMKRLLEEAQKNKESSLKYTTKLATIVLNNRAETEIFKEKRKITNNNKKKTGFFFY